MITAAPRAGGRDIDLRIVVAALLLLALVAWQAAGAAGADQAALVAVGGLLGITLYHASFGFTSAWRRFIATGDGSGLRAQMAMLALAVLLFFPALALGEVFGRPVSGAVAPVGVSVAVGAFIFGLGMQLGGGCASGTLYTVGGGSTRMVVTLAFFIIGSILGTAHIPFWYSLPSLGSISMVESLGVIPALIANLGLFSAVAGLTVAVERWRGVTPRPSEGFHLLKGPWPILMGAAGLALLNFATLWLAGRPWGVTWAFALWGAKWFSWAGIDVASWPAWQGAAGLIEASIWNDVTSVMNIAIILGAMLAAGLAGRFRPKLALGRAELITAVVGGLMLGYGARLAFGCNIGAFFSGVASGSLHGWLWLVCGFAGSVVGTWLRPRVGLAN